MLAMARQTNQQYPLLRVNNLSKHFDVSPPFLQRLLAGTDRVILKAVDGVSFSIPRGKTFSLVGESGCGKSTLARLVVGLYAPTSGNILFDDINLTDHTFRTSMGSVRRRLQMVFQDPHASLNPRWRVADIIAEPIRIHRLLLDQRAVTRRVNELLEKVRLCPQDGAKYPHEFSGGQQQRISIARALASEPTLLVCDEPTSALDVSVQAQILNLLKDLQEQLSLSYLFISHNLAVVYHVADYVGVMYLGRLVECGPTRSLFNNPQHPYTRMLLDAVPNIEMKSDRHFPIGGEVPSPITPPPGCHFHSRCPYAFERCRSETPMPIVRNSHEVRCHGIEEDRLELKETGRFGRN